jgi:hypothetical protein
LPPTRFCSRRHFACAKIACVFVRFRFKESSNECIVAVSSSNVAKDKKVRWQRCGWWASRLMSVAGRWNFFYLLNFRSLYLGS